MKDAWLLYVPAATSPLKAAATTPARHRLEMLRIAIRDLPRAAVWTDEIDRAAPDSPSFTVHTLQRAHAVAPDVRFSLLIGTDQAAQFHRWREYLAILHLAEPIVLLRPPLATREQFHDAMLKAGVWSPTEADRWAALCTADRGIPITGTNSTGIRAQLASGTAASAIAALDPKVAAYIEANHLYRSIP